MRCPNRGDATRRDGVDALGHSLALWSAGFLPPTKQPLRFQPVQHGVQGAAGQASARVGFEFPRDRQAVRVGAQAKDRQQNQMFELAENRGVSHMSLHCRRLDEATLLTVGKRLLARVGSRLAEPGAGGAATHGQ